MSSVGGATLHGREGGLQPSAMANMRGVDNSYCTWRANADNQSLGAFGGRSGRRCETCVAHVAPRAETFSAHY